MKHMTDNSSSKDTARLYASYMLSLSFFALAGSIVYFTYEMAMVSKQITTPKRYPKAKLRDVA